MVKGERRQRSVGEDELILADLEGSAGARATVVFARERRRRKALERWGQLQRIAEVNGLGERDAFDDVRLRVLYVVIGYVDEHVVRHEALLFRMEVRDLHRLVVVAAG